jgi:hypothetical protein
MEPADFCHALRTHDTSLKVPATSTIGTIILISKLFHNPVLKGHGFSHAAREQEDRGL